MVNSQKPVGQLRRPKWVHASGFPPSVLIYFARRYPQVKAGFAPQSTTTPKTGADQAGTRRLHSSGHARADCLSRPSWLWPASDTCFGLLVGNDEPVPRRTLTRTRTADRLMHLVGNDESVPPWSLLTQARCRSLSRTPSRRRKTGGHATARYHISANRPVCRVRMLAAL